MPENEAPCVELGSVPEDQNIITSPSPSEVSTASSPEPHNVQVLPTPLFRALAMTPPEPDQPPGQEELERRLPGYRRIVIPRELTLIELLKQSTGVATDEEVLQIREAKLRVMAEKIGLRRLHVLTPRLKSLTLDGSALSSLRDLGIGLVHLKMLSVNRCGLTCLDGVWGLGALRELHASGNRLQDLQPLAALQKLHTLNLSDNPITDTSRIWTLGVCSSLKRLTLNGTPASDLPDYRTRVASALPLLVFLDDRPMNVDDDEFEGATFDDTKGSESESSGGEEDIPKPKKTLPPMEPASTPSTSYAPQELGPDGDQDSITVELMPPSRRPRIRPSTTECAGERPKYRLPPRPRTAIARPVDMPTKLTILNTLMDEEWRCSGSKLTSHGAVCGNLARALRRPVLPAHSPSQESEHLVLHEALEDASRSLAAEIPRAPCLEDWEKFRTDTGIDIQLDFNARTVGDPFKAIERLEQIERETIERLNNSAQQTFAVNGVSSLSSISDTLWKDIQNMAPDANPHGDIDLPTHKILQPVSSSLFSASEDDVS